MKFGILLVTLFLCSPAVAAPPQTLQGRIYSERISLGAFVDVYERLVEFGDNNTWREILSTESHRPGFFRTARQPRTGTYTYEVLDSTSARLKFSPSQDGGDRILRFDDNQGGTARDPRLALAARNINQSNDDWGNTSGDALRMAQLVGAFPLLAGSTDAVLVLRLDPGAYVVTASVGDDDAGEILVEVYLFFAERQSR